MISETFSSRIWLLVSVFLSEKGLDSALCVCVFLSSLQVKLANVSKDFKGVLELRTEVHKLIVYCVQCMFAGCTKLHVHIICKTELEAAEAAS